MRTSSMVAPWPGPPAAPCCFPLLMTMEMWSLGVALERSRLLVFLLLTLPMLIGLSYFAGSSRPFG